MTRDLIPPEDAGTLFGLLAARTRRSGDAAAYRAYDRETKGWRDVGWAEMLARTERIAAGFAAAGLVPGDRVALVVPNGIDWVAFDMAAHRMGLPVVPLYTQDSAANAAHMLTDAAPKVLLADSAERWHAIAAAAPRALPLAEVWLWQGEAPAAAPDGPRMVPFTDVLTRADEPPVPAEVSADDTAALIYTSGTTGAPKGVMLSHDAILQNAWAVSQVVAPLPSDVFLSVLPLAHAFERTMGYALPMLAGATVAHAPSLVRLRQDMATIRPTVIMGVPRLYESIHDSARRSASASPVRARMLAAAERIGWRRHAARLGVGPPPSLPARLVWPLLDRTVCRKVTAAFGGRLRVAVSGGAEFPAEIGRALVGLGVPLVEGYGLTEAGPVVTASTLEAYLPGSVGYPIPGVEVRRGSDGDLRIMSPSLMQGYWQREAETAENFDADGWLRTGDLGELRDGRVHVTGRLKHLFVLSNGKNVNPQPLEVALSADPLFEQVCAVGDNRPFVAAILSLDPECWADFAKAEGLPEDRPNSEESQKALLAHVRAAQGDFASYQQVKAIHAVRDRWSVENRMLTPTLKVRRAQVIETYRDQIGTLYRRGSRGRSVA